MKKYTDERAQTSYLRKLREIRENENIQRCKICGIDLMGSEHHFFCERCWTLRKTGMYREINRLKRLNKKNENTKNSHSG